MESFHSEDVRQLYCACCHIFHDDELPEPPALDDPAAPPLFIVPEHLSPKLAWMRRHDARTMRYRGTRAADAVPLPWIAWRGDFQDAIDTGAIHEGTTQDDALTRLATAHAWPLWL